ncbi:unnamed protein product [Pleuronectes platessa]|uniref:Uncharacterized protein n=1 Tax=Pleuronectes platessa TaxID=8262 RepID=A0A9N7YXH4_PLEPL|nr:unnamed protein product [Pleuronectes platessa]
MHCTGCKRNGAIIPGSRPFARLLWSSWKWSVCKAGSRCCRAVPRLPAAPPPHQTASPSASATRPNVEVRPRLSQRTAN